MSKWEFFISKRSFFVRADLFCVNTSSSKGELSSLCYIRLLELLRLQSEDSLPLVDVLPCVWIQEFKFSSPIGLIYSQNTLVLGFFIQSYWRLKVPRRPSPRQHETLVWMAAAGLIYLRGCCCPAHTHTHSAAGFQGYISRERIREHNWCVSLCQTTSPGSSQQTAK